jgi:hypothetical protein
MPHNFIYLTLIFKSCFHNIRIKSFWQSLRILDIVLPEDPVIPLLSIYPEDAPTCNQDTCYVHSSLIYNSQELKRIPMSFNRGMDTKNVHLHNGILLGY